MFVIGRWVRVPDTHIIKNFLKMFYGPFMITSSRSGDFSQFVIKLFVKYVDACYTNVTN